MAERVYMFAGALLASAPSISVEQALRLAVKILGVIEEAEQFRQLSELWESIRS